MTNVNEKQQNEYLEWCKFLNRPVTNDSCIEWLQFEKDVQDNMSLETGLITIKK